MIDYRAARRALIVAHGGRCVMCGRRRALEFAHLKPTGLAGRGRGRAARYYDVKRNPDKYVLLCRWDHRWLDMELLRVDSPQPVQTGEMCSGGDQASVAACALPGTGPAVECA